MYLVDMHPNERDEYQEAVRASKASKWNREHAKGFMRSKIKIGKSSYLIHFFHIIMYKIMYFDLFLFFLLIVIGESSQPSDPSRRMQRSQNV